MIWAFFLVNYHITHLASFEISIYTCIHFESAEISYLLFLNLLLRSGIPGFRIAVDPYTNRYKEYKNTLRIVIQWFISSDATKIIKKKKMLMNPIRHAVNGPKVVVVVLLVNTLTVRTYSKHRIVILITADKCLPKKTRILNWLAARLLCLKALIFLLILLIGWNLDLLFFYILWLYYGDERRRMHA